VSWRFAGSYEHQQRAMATLRVVLPLSLGIIFLILYFQFKSVSTVLVLFSSILVAWASGFFMLYLYGQEWFWISRCSASTCAGCSICIR
jgi:copper/silver efflux system protein